MDFRPVLYTLGALVVLLAAGMILPTLTDLAMGNPDWQTFLIALFLTAMVGGMMMLSTRDSGDALNLRQAFLVTTLAWAVLPGFAALPLAFSELDLSFTDAYFEAMSGLTTTGSTVISGLDHTPPGILLWRSLLQWFGGIGIVVMAVAVLPMLQVGGMQVFKVESFETVEKILPRAAQISVAMSGLYVAFTALCMMLYMIAGMGAFDALAHSMTAISTGGFSTSDASLGKFDSYAIDMITLVFMIIGSMPFLLFLQVLRGRPVALWRDEQTRGFLSLVLFLCAFVTVWLVIWKDFTVADAFRFGSFNIISVLTGTGYASTDYGQWGAFSSTLFFFVMFIGGCAGSTSCGIKIFRFQVLLKSMRSWIRHTVQPNGVFVARYNGRPIPSDVRGSVMSFLMFFMAIFLVLSILVASTGADLITAMSAVGSAMANVGPGVGDVVGPAGNFSSLTDTAKWLLSFGMLIGRLELFSVLVLFSPAFWRA
ncbi:MULTISPECIES: TrkH family potassium uptake protein [Kordiimonas]|jgi:trk system potassium uptake protein TrkH|uniref:TrkH family potassium uptake protein n=1 Tax=Kordiimonas TaxID=288021 RepID=UPI0025801155|nr:TrkH family potassium uptake protein [Kordiimonas sp. UBA4487]